MKTYTERMKKAKQRIYNDMANDIIAAYGPQIMTHGFTETRWAWDDDYETLIVHFTDPEKGDRFHIGLSTEHTFDAGWHGANDDSDEPEDDGLTEQQFPKTLAKMLSELGWMCEECGGDGEIETEDGDTATCPYCDGRGYMREKAA